MTLQSNQSGIDIQLGYATHFTSNFAPNEGKRIGHDDFQPAAMLMRGR
jgi:hypothetical protein